jgi:hypothetical protein
MCVFVWVLQKNLGVLWEIPLLVARVYLITEKGVKFWVKEREREKSIIQQTYGLILVFLVETK